MSLYQQVIKKKLTSDKDSIVFSSEDSFNTDNSFNSSVENDNNNGKNQNKTKKANCFLSNFRLQKYILSLKRVN